MRGVLYLFGDKEHGNGCWEEVTQARVDGGEVAELGIMGSDR